MAVFITSFQYLRVCVFGGLGFVVGMAAFAHLYIWSQMFWNNSSTSVVVHWSILTLSACLLLAWNNSSTSVVVHWFITLY